MEQPRIYALNAHATWACRHSGACCTAGWSIPVEPRIRRLVQADWLLPDDSGACPQYDRPSGLCRIHRDHGEAMLPESCHHFPRRALVDDRGTFVALSHYCPTAAALLLDGTAPLTIETRPPAFPQTRAYEGLDATGEWPPLLRPDTLFDAASFELWERYLVESIGQSESDPLDTLHQAAAVAEALRGWTADAGALAEWTGACVRGAPADADTRTRYAAFAAPDIYQFVCATVPDGVNGPTPSLTGPDTDLRLVAPTWRTYARLVNRYLGARAFASWTAYQSRGVRTQMAELFVTLAVLRVECGRACAAAQRGLDRERLGEAVRATDLLLVHLADRQALMAGLGKVE